MSHDTVKLDEESLQLFRDLIAAVEDDLDFKEAIKCCRQLLDESIMPIPLASQMRDKPEVVSAIHEIYLKSLLHCDDYSTVLDLLSDDVQTKKKKSASSFIINRDDPRFKPLEAYALYRKGGYKEASALCLSSEDESMKLIWAQSQFHLGQLEKAQESFLSLVKDNTDDEMKMQLLTNTTASMIAKAVPYCKNDEQYASAVSTIEDFIKRKEDESSSDFPYELAHNLATWQLMTGGDRSSSKALLQKSATACELQNLDEPKKAQVRESGPIQTNLQLFDQAFWNPHVALNESKETDADLAAPVQSVRKINSVTLGISANAKEALKVLKQEPNEKLTPLQQRIWFYNRAVAQLRAGAHEECISSCQALQSELKSSGSSQKNSKKKKNASDADPLLVSEKPSLIVRDKQELAWWESRIAVLVAYCQREQFFQDSNEDESTKKENLCSNLQTHLAKLKEMSRSAVIDHSLLYVQIHLHHLEQSLNVQAKDFKKDSIACLQNDMPESLATKPAILATLASLHHMSGQDDQAKRILESTGIEEAVADFAMSQGKYEEAAIMYEKAAKSESDSLATARWVRALSYFDPSKAMKLWSELDIEAEFSDDEEEDDALGAELEARELPRLKSTKTRKNDLLEEPSSANEKKNKKSHDAVLRRRARKREAYLAELQKRGVYNPDQPTKPDPERWLPKFERSYNRKRRNRGGGVHKGAQGGISDKDAAKLDIVARQEARARGEVDAGGRSTAHIAAVGGGIGRKSKGKKR